MDDYKIIVLCLSVFKTPNYIEKLDEWVRAGSQNLGFNNSKTCVRLTPSNGGCLRRGYVNNWC